MPERFENKVVIVTAGAQGIGKGIALRFSEEGAKVVVADINAGAGDDAVRELQKKGREALAVKTDVSSAGEVKSMIDSVIDKFGRIDILVNNAGVNKPAFILDVKEEDWDLMMKVNLKGVFLCCQTVIPYMIKQKSGKIINISSVSGKKGGTWLSPYCATKFGVIGFTQSIARELAPYNINVNSVCPGIVFTPLWDKLANVFSRKLDMPSDKVKEYYVSRIPLKRPATAKDIAKVVTFMCSDDADYMTGQAINVTGGEEMR